jgi:hypothetical protein
LELYDNQAETAQELTTIGKDAGGIKKTPKTRQETRRLRVEEL